MVKIGKEAWGKITAANPGSPSRVQSLVSVRWQGERVRGYMVGTLSAPILYAIEVCAVDRGILSKKGYRLPVIIVKQDDLIVK